VGKEPATPSPEALFAQASPAVVRIVVYDDKGKEIGQGSGFFVKSDGTLVTNYHVVRGATFAEVLLSTNATYFVFNVLAWNEEADLAVLKVNGTDLPYLRLAPLTVPPKVGARVYAIGNPLGLTNTLSEGLVSGVRKQGERIVAIQITAPISPGSSGGPLLDTGGEVIGVTTAYMKVGQNLNLAIPGKDVQTLLVKAETTTPVSLASAGGIQLDQQGTATDYARRVAALEAIYKQGDRLVGPAFRKEAQDRAVKALVEAGYSKENPPDALTEKMALSRAYADIVLKQASKKPETQAVSETRKRLASDLDMARIYRRNGLLDKAKGLLEAIIKTYPETPEAKEAQKELQEIQGKAEKPGEKVVVPKSEERQRIIADVQELLSQAGAAMGRAKRLEDYNEALRMLAAADLIITQASVLSAEEAERLREEVYVLRKEIVDRKRLAEKQ